MSPANGPPDDATECGPKAAAVTKLGRLILVCAVVLTAAPALGTVHPARPQSPIKTSPPVKQTPQSQVPQSQEPEESRQRPQKPRRLTVSADREVISLCPGVPVVVRLTVKDTFDEKGQPAYAWNAEGEIKGDLRGASWNLSGLKEGAYTASLTVKARDWVGLGRRSVKVEGCRAPARACPKITLNGPNAVTAGEKVTFKLSLEGGAPDVKPSIEWATDGPARIIAGQNTTQLDLETAKVKADSKASVRVSLIGYDESCEDNRSFLVQPSPTPTPDPTSSRSPTPPPTPTDEPVLTTSPSPAASPSPSPVALTVATPGVTPQTPTPALSGTPEAPDTLVGGRWLIPLAAFAAVGALVLLAARRLLPRMKSSLGGTTSETTIPPDAGSTSTPGPLKREGAAAVVYGGLEKRSDVVHCTVFAPLRVAPGDNFLVQVFAHLARQAKQAAEQAAKADAAAHDRGSRPLGEEVERGTLLTFTLEMPGLHVDEAHKRGETLVWRGAPDSVQFAVDVPEDFAPPKTIRCTSRIYSGEALAPVGHIMFMLDVVPAAATQPAAASVTSPPPQAVKRYTHAFVSYCSKDRPKILPIYLGKRTEWRKAGITDFFDRKDIGSGDVWNEEIQKNLDRCDLFVLFWSSAAQCSEEVGKEIAYALARKGGDEWQPPTFDPLSVELPVPRPLPAGLESLNFDDPLLYFIKAEEAIREEGDAPPTRPGGGAA